MKSYHDIVGDGGSRVLEQVAGQRSRIADGLAGVRHLVAVGSGKGGVGKSTLTLHLAGALRARGLRIAILDADFNGPSQARMAGVQGALFVPGSHKVALPRARNGIGVFSLGSLIPESESLEFESAARGESHTWRATREFALLSEILGSFEWGTLDLLLFDLPPGAERTVQYADFLGPRTSFLLVTIPSEVARGVVARSVAALSKGPNRLLGYVENMSGYYCRDCNAIKPLFPSTQAAGRPRSGQACGYHSRFTAGDPVPRDRPVRSGARAALRLRDPADGTARNTRWPGPRPRGATASGQPRIGLGSRFA
jgi:ATP-binding protein involved in chromosome partitioning